MRRIAVAGVAREADISSLLFQGCEIVINWLTFEIEGRGRKALPETRINATNGFESDGWQDRRQPGYGQSGVDDDGGRVE